MRKSFMVIMPVLVLIAVGNFSSCYYDREDLLYPIAECDTIYNYNGGIKKIMDKECARSGCHSGPSPEGGLALTNYTEVRTAVAEFGILCNIRQESGCAPMPKNEQRIANCKIESIEKWKDRGYPEN